MSQSVCVYQDGVGLKIGFKDAAMVCGCHENGVLCSADVPRPRDLRILLSGTTEYRSPSAHRRGVG